MIFFKWILWKLGGSKIFLYNGYHCGCCGKWVKEVFKIQKYKSQGDYWDTWDLCPDCEKEGKMKWKKPYELKQKRFWMFYYKFEITFDKTVIYQVIGGFCLYLKVKQLTNLLNAAYNLGYLEKQFEEEAKNATKNSHL